MRTCRLENDKGNIRECGSGGIEYMEGPLDTTNASSDKTSEKMKGKKPYKAPSFRFQAAFEVSALVCGKIDPTQGTCTSNRKAS